MEFTTTPENESCQHEEYCNFAKNICATTNFKTRCRMKNTDVNDMPLTKKIKERVLHDRQRKFKKSKK